MRCGIYLIECVANGLKYVGQSCEIETRWAWHRRALHRYPLRYGSSTANERLAKTFKKYGEASFEFRVLEECATEDLTSREIFWLNLLRADNPDCIANSDGPADCPRRGVPHKPETCQKIGAKHRGKKLSPSTIEKMRAARKGRKASAETRAKLSAMRQGQPDRLDEESRRRLSERMSGPRHPGRDPVHRPKFLATRFRKRIMSSDGRDWDSGKSAAAALGVSAAAVAAAASGKSRSCCGLILRYAA
jgi:group I intron endonuclease